MKEIWIYALWSAFITSLISFIGVFTLSFKTEFLKRILVYMISLSAGALLWDVFIHLLPELTNEIWFNIGTSLGIIAWIMFSFILEKILHWRHCHHPTTSNHPHPVALMNLVWDSMHNFLDWLMIWGSFLISIPIWISTVIAIILHEIPQEIWDFWVLVHAWYSIKKALFLNFIVSLATFGGIITILLLWNIVSDLNNYLVPITSWTFIYIASSDLIPEMHKNKEIQGSIIQIMVFLLWVVAMLLLK